MEENTAYKKRIFLANSRIRKLSEMFDLTERTIYDALAFKDIERGHNNKKARKIRYTALKELNGVIVEVDKN